MNEIRTKYLKQEDFTVSATAKKLKLNNSFVGNKTLEDNAKYFAVIWQQYIEPILDDAYAKSGCKEEFKLTVASIYRSKELNKAIGGSPTSAHCLCLAIDFYVNFMQVKDLFKFIASRLNNVPFDQLLLESEGGIIHLGLKRDAKKCRKQVGYAKIVSGKWGIFPVV